MFAVQTCGLVECNRPLYVLVEPGNQRIYCGACGSVTLFVLNGPAKQGDGDEVDE